MVRPLRSGGKIHCLYKGLGSASRSDACSPTALQGQDGRCATRRVLHTNIQERGIVRMSGLPWYFVLFTREDDTSYASIRIAYTLNVVSPFPFQLSFSN